MSKFLSLLYDPVNDSRAGLTSEAGGRTFQRLAVACSKHENGPVIAVTCNADYLN